MITQNYFTVSPTYGRDYKSKAEAERAFRSSKDFQMQSVVSGFAGSYCSVRDFAPGIKVKVRYGKMQKGMVVTV